jgi:hypothetical protein
MRYERFGQTSGSAHQESPPRGSLPPRWRPLGISRSFRVPPGEVPCLLVPRSRFAVSHFLGCAVFLRLAALATLSDQCNLSSSSAFLQSLEQSCPSRPAAASQLLSWAFVPYSTPGFGGLPAAGLASARYVPSSGFGYPLDGLLPPSPCRFCFTPAALLGFTLRSFLLPKGTRRVSAVDEPAYRFSRRYSRPPKRMGRPNEPRFPGFHPSGSPWQPCGG